MRALVTSVLLLVLSTPALAEQGDPAPAPLVWWAHLALTVIGSFVAVQFACQAFDKRQLPLANAATFPKYMANPQQYRLGSYAYMAFALGFFLLLVYLHKEVLSLASFFPGFLPKFLADAAKEPSATYLAIVFVMGAVYISLLKIEAQWNVLLTMRDVIQSWISIPQLAYDVLGRIETSLQVPETAVQKVIEDFPTVRKADFRKDKRTPDRAWAELCYMKRWLSKRRDEGNDAIFFTEESFGFDSLLSALDQNETTFQIAKSGQADKELLAKTAAGLKDLHKKFARLIACYLVYRNGSRPDLIVECKSFGINLTSPTIENPLRYAIVYILTLAACVYLGVYGSAILYDCLQGDTLLHALSNQDPGRVASWLLYSAANYGLAMIAVLTMWFVMAAFGDVPRQSHLITYCWAFLLALVVGPVGLAVTLHFGPIEEFQKTALPVLFLQMFTWGLGPAMVSVYISYYLDRQICSDLPNIDQSYATIGWRLLNTFGFAVVTVIILLPRLLGLTARVGPWDDGKLRAVATGTTFVVAFGLAFAAQFVLRKRSSLRPAVLTPEPAE